MNHISTVRQHLLDQMAALRAASGAEAIKQELDKAKGISELAQVAVNTAKVEVDYLIATDQTVAPFLEAPSERPYVTGLASSPFPTADTPAAPPVLSSVVGVRRHRLEG
ncbi:hypothetical protein [Variovorax paradoxus]|uniref:hypothetical protein n=1 Tax=Variovorax paradoxus TaxID=34073 RepID=UPI001ABC4812